jgi:hypothetical protein
MRYNEGMIQGQKCSSNRVAKWIRVTVSLGIIAAGIIYKNWVGLLGVVTLFSAFCGACPLSLQFTGLHDVRIRRNSPGQE